MSARGRNRDKTYTRAHGGDVPSAQLKLLQRTDDHPKATSVQDRLVAPNPAEMRRAISNGECPFCGRKYHNIAAHTNRAHGVDRFELKELMGIPKTQPACAPEYSETCRDRSSKVFAEDPDGVRSRLRAKGNPHIYSAAGREINMAKLQQARAAQQTKIVAEGFSSNVEWLAERNHQRFLERTEGRDAAIADMVRAGATQAEVLEAFGLKNRQIIRDACAREGVSANFRSRRMYTPEQQARSVVAVKAMHDAHRKRSADRRAAILARWAELGKTWGAVEVLAAEFSVSEGGVRAFLRHNGELVPDGRVVSPRRLKAKCRNGHERNEINTRIKPSGKLICRICETRSKKRYLARKAAKG